ncbi:hypothetical protein [Nitratireductor alexandrii]|uniref:hypothetical protein n=1 Tax=Nitratireductor alexandrii TaxID=2448161 RepID=UPI000FD7C7C0|nr:hypothetical protein [Nitratireductor alexandrii]
MPLNTPGAEPDRSRPQHDRLAPPADCTPLSGALLAMSGWALVWLAIAAASAARWPLIVQDDARHFVIWLRQQADPSLFAGDAIADQFRTLTPWAYEALYRPFTLLGADALLVHLLVMMAALGALFSLSVYLLTYELWPSRRGAALVGAIAPLVLGGPTAAVGLPKTFGVIIIALSLLTFLRRRPVLTAAALFVGTGLYPATVAVSGLAMALLCLKPGFPFVATDRRTLVTLAAGGIAALAGGLVFMRELATLGPTFSLEQARQAAIFSPGGRLAFFEADGALGLWCNRNGYATFCFRTLAPPWRGLVAGLLLALFFGLAWAIANGRAARPMRRLGLPEPPPRLAGVALAVLAAGLILHSLALLLLFRLHEPSRYGHNAVKTAFVLVVLPFAAAAVIGGARRLQRHGWSKAARALVFTPGLIVAVAMVATSAMFFSKAPAIHAYLRQTPKDTLVGGFSRELDLVPAFSSRGVYAAYELMIPYKKTYHDLLYRRITQTVLALYQVTPDAFTAFARDSGIDYVLVDRGERHQRDRLRRWQESVPAVAPALRFLEAGKTPFFKPLETRCAVARSPRQLLLDAACLSAR